MKRMEYDEFARVRDEQGLRVIDVREPDEFEEVHVRDAELFPLSRIQRGELPEDDGRPVALICRSGGRSAMAAPLFERGGFAETINVEGGTLAALAAGKEEDLVR
ncbi:MAG: rhodanese-like domain-containing protein [Myxococcota bacterium]